MPIPQPTSNQSESEFMQVCMAAIRGEYSATQAAAICNDAWRNRNKTNKNGKGRQN